MCRIPGRYFILVLLCICSIGFVSVNDTPGALQNAIMRSVNIDAYKFSFLFSVAAWPSCFSFLNGFIIDRYLGVRLATFIFIVVLTSGSILFLIGSFINSYSFLIIGRALYGLGADPLILCCNTYIVHWFASNNELNMVFAMVMSLPWFGSSLVYFMCNRIFQHVQKYYHSYNALGLAVSATLPFTVTMTLSSLIIALAYRAESSEQDAIDKTKNKPTWRDILKFPLLFWLMSTIINMYSLVLMTFLMLSQESLSKRYNMSLDEASNISSIFSLIVCLVSSPLGMLLDKFGRNLTFVSIAVLFGLLGHGIMAFTSIHPLSAVIILAFSYSMVSSAYLPLVSYLVEKHQTTTAYGIAQSGVNGSFALGSLIVGRIVADYGYRAEEKFYFFLLLFTVPFWIVVWLINFYQGNKLNMSAKQKAYSESENTKIDNEERTLDIEATGLSTPPASKKTVITNAKDTTLDAKENNF